MRCRKRINPTSALSQTRDAGFLPLKPLFSTNVARCSNAFAPSPDFAEKSFQPVPEKKFLSNELQTKKGREKTGLFSIVQTKLLSGVPRICC
jgi:hypothetical protein